MPTMAEVSEMLPRFGSGECGVLRNEKGTLLKVSDVIARLEYIVDVEKEAVLRVEDFLFELKFGRKHP